ncbi:MAG: 2-oxoacid:acceptor oxidoreductase subunit alpha, partial [Hyphomicrobiales bacterium]
YKAGDDMVPPMVRPGDGFRTHTTGLTHDENGFPTQAPARVNAAMVRLLGKIDHHRELIEKFECIDCDDAEIIIVTIGISARAARGAVRLARTRGLKVGLFRPITLWPFPEDAFRRTVKNVAHVIVPEMNAGQLVLEVERLVSDKTRVTGLNRVDGEPIAPDEILRRIEEVGQ